MRVRAARNGSEPSETSLARQLLDHPVASALTRRVDPSRPSGWMVSLGRARDGDPHRSTLADFPRYARRVSLRVARRDGARSRVPDPAWRVLGWRPAPPTGRVRTPGATTPSHSLTGVADA